MASDTMSGVLLLGITVTTILARQILMPMINAATDGGQTVALHLEAALKGNEPPFTIKEIKGTKILPSSLLLPQIVGT